MYRFYQRRLSPIPILIPYRRRAVPATYFVTFYVAASPPTICPLLKVVPRPIIQFRLGIGEIPRIPWTDVRVFSHFFPISVKFNAAGVVRSNAWSGWSPNTEKETAAVTTTSSVVVSASGSTLPSTDSAQHRRPPLPTGVIVGVSVAVAGVVFTLALAFFLLRARRRHRNDAEIVSPFVRVGSETPEGSLPSNSPRRHAKERLHYLEAELSTAHSNIQELSARGTSAFSGGRAWGRVLGGGKWSSKSSRWCWCTSCVRGGWGRYRPSGCGVNRLEAEIREARALDGPPAYTAG
ncbi:hypothetical protein B0H14DRAFT_2580059 [Mycena olivaceomarginata]|nr:hypothetical protein B0H14DRAFT_2580059 [Mycena olivaceomarginata]